MAKYGIIPPCRSPFGQNPLPLPSPITQFVLQVKDKLKTDSRLSVIFPLHDRMLSKVRWMIRILFFFNIYGAHAHFHNHHGLKCEKFIFRNVLLEAENVRMVANEKFSCAIITFIAAHNLMKFNSLYLIILVQ